MGLTQLEERNPFQATVRLANADGTGNKDLIASAAHITRIDNLFVVNSDTVSHTVQIVLAISAVQNTLGAIIVPAGGGISDGIIYDAISLLFPTGLTALVLPVGGELMVNVSVAVTSGKLVEVTALGGTF